MKQLKIVLQSNIFFFLIIVLLVVYVIYFTIIKKYTSSFADGASTITGKVNKYTITDDKLVIYLKTDKELIKATYYFKVVENVDISFNDIYTLEGNLSTPTKNTIPNNFNYQKYLYNNKIYKVMTIKSFIKKDSNHNVFASIKSYIYKRAYQNDYLLLFICGDKTLMDNDTYSNFKDVGIAHLLAISGMHVSIFIAILNKLLSFIKENLRKIIIIIFLFFYSYIVNFSPSILRVIIFFTLSFILNKLDIKMSSIKRLLLTGIIILAINPFNIFMTAFHYSFVTSLSIILVQKRLSKNYFLNIILISFWTLLFTLPITASLNYEINLLTFLSNLLFIPYVSFFLYPFSLICFIVPKFLPVFDIFTSIMENIIDWLSKVKFLTINIPKMSIMVIILIYLFLLLFVLIKKKRYFILVMGIIIYSKIKPKLDNASYIIFFDVGQGDSNILIGPHQKSVIMIDTGGIRNKKVSDGVILYLKSIGITKIDSLVLSHGDYDHMGDAINIVKNLKVGSVVFNHGDYNNLELNLIEVLKEKGISYSQNVKKISIKDNKLLFLDTNFYDNENDNSNVNYINFNGYKFLFMGDSSIEVEEELIDKYQIDKIDVLKVGHHGSRTSTSEKLINKFNPNYSIISVGKNNMYGHPNQSVLTTLKSSIIYRTDINGTIIFKLNKNLDILTYEP